MVRPDGVRILPNLVHDDVLHRRPIALELHADGASSRVLLAVWHDHTLLHRLHMQVGGLEGSQQVGIPRSRLHPVRELQARLVGDPVPMQTNLSSAEARTLMTLLCLSLSNMLRGHRGYTRFKSF